MMATSSQFRSPRRHLLIAFLTLLFGAGGFAAWSLVTEIEGAVVARGELIVAARRQVIQHPDGGVVKAIHVREGSMVEAGDPLLELDGAELRARRAVTARSLAQVLAREDRLRAQIENAADIAWRPEITRLAASVPDLPRILATEAGLFASHRAIQTGAQAAIRERQAQTRAAIAGRLKQLAASRRQRELVGQELASAESLLERGLTRAGRVSDLRRELARLDGVIGEIEAGIAESRSTLAQYEIERLARAEAAREAARAELAETQPGEVGLREKLRLLDSRIGRLVLRAPMSGQVLGLRVNTIGGVVPPGEEIVSIVPTDAPLVLSVRIAPEQIDRVAPGQPASVRFPGFDLRSTPEVAARITTVSADAVTDPVTARRHYRAELELAPDARERLGGRRLLPGMPAEAFIHTGPRTPASFLVKPIADYWAHALRED